MACSFFSIEAFLVLTLLIHMNADVLSSSVETDHLALLEIKSTITDDPQGVFKSWNDSFPFCLWQGVTCSCRHQRVTRLNLTSKGLVGSLSPYLGNLSFLTYLTLDDSQLHGSIPSEITRLYRLQRLSLQNNSFTGEIPANMSSCSRLSVVRLSFNMLSRKISNTFSSMPMIKTLSLSKNYLTGGIPPTIGNLTTLEILGLDYCPLGGTIPYSFIKLQNLRKVSLGECGLTGAFPSFLFNLSMLEHITVTANQLHGSLPSNLCFTQPHLQILELGLNHFNGFLPPSMSNCSELEIISVGPNDFTGNIAIDFGQLQSLSLVFLGSNHFESNGPDGLNFLDSLSNCANNFIATIPESLGKLQNLQDLYLDRNAFSGSFPRSIGNLSLLTQLELGNNKFEGTIGSCKKLTYLSVHTNNLEGTIPKELFQLSSLSIKLDLSPNNLSGLLPPEIGNLKALGSLDLSQNLLSSEVPSSLSSCTSLEILNLSSNLFDGPMLEALSSLKGLLHVNMSHNNLSGNIPTNLRQIPFKQLDLSYNNFDGEVPVEGVFANRSAISVIGTNRLCGGIPELNLTKCTITTSDSKRDRKLSTRVVIAISLSSTIAGLALVSFMLFYFCIKKKVGKAPDTLSIKSFEKISYGNLFKATEGFSSEHLIGTGSFASVYKGSLEENGLIVAIKVITSCSSADYQGNDFKALVYDFMPKGSLESWLHSIDHTLDLSHRINIIKDVACALDYLHCQCGNIVVHCDLKPSNILLDDDWLLMSEILVLQKFLPLMKFLMQTIVAQVLSEEPSEYGFGNEVSTSGDIYSYGILLLEMLTGKKPVDPMFEEGLSLHSYARSALADGYVLQIVDRILLNENVNENSLISLMKIGVQCSSESPQDRMNIGTIIHDLFSLTFTTRCP
ncbi:leucine-rich repeat protein [Artemisia annua]|uniref:non-specific serine/threonine protein kinase n=1 Tax=Artemisia annua TaxID=35608 RepID=A0A2U1NWX9_ARTAN|nr:leucine-rich repeat protein [Artemisia annua]